MALMEISRSRFKQTKKLSAYYMNLYYGPVFCKFLGDFWVCKGGSSSFSKDLQNLKKNKKYWRLNKVLKLKFIVNNK